MSFFKSLWNFNKTEEKGYLYKAKVDETYSIQYVHFLQMITY